MFKLHGVKLTHKSLTQHIMTTQTTLSIHASMSEAGVEEQRLRTLFKKAHQKSEKVNLFLCLSDGPEGKPEYSVRVHWTKEQENEAKWFINESTLEAAK